MIWGCLAYLIMEVTQVTPEETPPLLLDIFGFKIVDKLYTIFRRIT